MGARDILTTAVEQGSGYWAEIKDIKRDAEGLVTAFDVWTPGDGHYLTTVTEAKLDDAIRLILKGAVTINKSIVAQFIGYFPDGNDDTDTIGADCAVQVAVFGSIVYG